MIRKRSSLNNISDIKRRKNHNSDSDNGAPKDTRNTLLYLSSIFPVEKFQQRLPPIILRHQIYAFVTCRTEVDKCLNDMRKKGEIRLFKLGQKEDELAIVSMKEYRQHLEKCCPNNPIVESFLRIVEQCPDISYSKTVLVNTYGMKEENISELIQQGALTGRDVGCYWLSVPRIGEFVKTLVYGRRTVLQHIKRTKYKEILQSELQERKLPPKVLLGMLYHVYDIIGSDLVTCVNTSSGIVLRLQIEQAFGH